MALSNNGSPVVHLEAPNWDDTNIAPLPTDRVIIPAKNAAATILETVRYAMSCGFHQNQILVVVNGSTDNTAEIASNETPVRVVLLSEVLARPAYEIATVAERITLLTEAEKNRVHGKGAAIFAGAMELKRDNLPLDARIFLLDVDITNVRSVNPLGHLLYGWDKSPDTVRLVKLALLGRDGETTHAVVAQHSVGRYRAIGAFTWPLCGQQSLRWDDLKRIYLATGYAVEVSIIADILDRSPEHAGLFCEVVLNNPIHDRPNTVHDTTRMMVQITAYLQRRSSNHLSPVAMNRLPAEIDAYLPPDPAALASGSGTTLERLTIDATLPPVVQVV